MNNSRIDGRLQKLVQRESRSLLQYVGDSLPWPSIDDADITSRLKEIADGERRSLAAVMEWLRRHKVPIPYLGPYPEEFTALNFVSLDYLLWLLVNEEREAIANLEQDAAAVAEEQARALVDRWLQGKRRHLEQLERLREHSLSAAEVG